MFETVQWCHYLCHTSSHIKDHYSLAGIVLRQKKTLIKPENGKADVNIHGFFAQ